jgi:glutamyl-tRNA reductase
MVGEHEIIGQLKSAYRQALEAHSAQFIMNRLMHRAFRVAKRVQTETRLGQGATSLSEGAVEVARRTLGDLSGKTALLIGAGEAAELAARALARSGITHLIVANRSLAHAQRLAEQFATAPNEPAPEAAARRAPQPCSLEAGADARRSVRAVPLGRLASVLSRADLIISSTGSPAGVLTRAHFSAARRRLQRPLLIMDLAVPRDVAPDVAELPHVTLLNLDDLGRVVSQNLRRRREEIPRAEAIVSEEAQWFARWLESLDAIGVIKLLRLSAVEIQQDELRRYQSKFTPADRERLERFAHGLCSKLLRAPISFLRSEGAADAGDGSGLVNMDLVRRMFRLESEEAEH